MNAISKQVTMKLICLIKKLIFDFRSSFACDERFDWNNEELSSDIFSLNSFTTFHRFCAKINTPEEYFFSRLNKTPSGVVLMNFERGEIFKLEF